MTYYKTEWRYSNDYFEDGGKYLTCHFCILFLKEDDKIIKMTRKCVHKFGKLKDKTDISVSQYYIKAMKLLLKNMIEIDQNTYDSSVPFVKLVTFNPDNGGMELFDSKESTKFIRSQIESTLQVIRRLLDQEKK